MHQQSKEKKSPANSHVIIWSQHYICTREIEQWVKLPLCSWSFIATRSPLGISNSSMIPGKMLHAKNVAPLITIIYDGSFQWCVCVQHRSSGDLQLINSTGFPEYASPARVAGADDPWQFSSCNVLELKNGHDSSLIHFLSHLLHSFS